MTSGPKPVHDQRHFRYLARRLLAAGQFGDNSLRESGVVGEALEVLHPDRQPHSWFVPVTVGDRLAAFLQFRPDGAFIRFSAFPRPTGGFEHCPSAVEWLDASKIQARAAAAQQKPGETVGRPFLTYDNAPDRLVWAVPLTHAGQVRLLFVIGDYVYAAP